MREYKHGEYELLMSRYDDSDIARNYAHQSRLFKAAGRPKEKELGLNQDVFTVVLSEYVFTEFKRAGLFMDIAPSHTITFDLPEKEEQIRFKGFIIPREGIPSFLEFLQNLRNRL